MTEPAPTDNTDTTVSAAESTATAPEPADAPQAPEPTTEAPDTDPRLGKLRSEARSLRERAKTAEAELESLRATVNGYRRTEIEALAAQQLRDPTDIWAAGEDVTDYLDESGNVDAERVTAAVQALTESKPHYRKVTAPPTNRPTQALRPGASPAAQQEPMSTWASALRGH